MKSYQLGLYEKAMPAALPEDLRALGREPLVLTPLKVGMLKNHGYSQLRLSGHDAAVVAWEGGVARFDPPAAPGEPWVIKPLLSVPTSDAVLADFDGDGQLELGCISPFHGASLTIYHLDDCGNDVPRWKYPAPEAETAFLHATWAAPSWGGCAGRWAGGPAADRPWQSPTTRSGATM